MKTYEWFRTEPRFDTEAKGNSEMAFCLEFVKIASKSFNRRAFEKPQTQRVGSVEGA